MNIKHIAATLAILGSASFTMTGCKDKGSTEVPGADEKKPEGSCGAGKDGSCSAEKKAGGDASCSGEKKEGGEAPAGDAAAEAPAE